MALDAEILARMDELSPAERKVARALLAGYPGAGLESAARLARAAGTSAPTVLRLLARLGFGGYPDFQARLRSEISARAESPLQRSREGMAATRADTFSRALAERVRLIESLHGCVPPSEFDRAVAALSAPSRRIVVSGGYFSRYFAMVLASQLDQVVANVDLVLEPLGHDIGKYLGLGRGGVAVLLDFRRHEQSARDAARVARDRGATVIVITDTSLSPAVESADIVIPVTVDGIPFDSMAPLLVVLEALVEGVLRAAGRRGLDRMREWEDSVHIARAQPAAALALGLPRDDDDDDGDRDGGGDHEGDDDGDASRPAGDRHETAGAR